MMFITPVNVANIQCYYLVCRTLVFSFMLELYFTANFPGMEQ